MKKAVVSEREEMQMSNNIINLNDRKRFRNNDFTEEDIEKYGKEEILRQTMGKEYLKKGPSGKTVSDILSELEIQKK